MRKQAEVVWYRVLGRLQRITALTMQPRSTTARTNPPMEDTGDNTAHSNNSPPTAARGDFIADVGPTDPEVYGAGRPRTPPANNRSTAITPTSELILDIINEIGNNGNGDSSGRDTVNGHVTVPHTPFGPPPAYSEAGGSRRSSAGSLVETTYIEMHPDPARRPPIPLPTSMPPPATAPRSSTRSENSGRRAPPPRAREQYEEMAEPFYYNHQNVRRPIPVPQGSPRPPLPAEIPAPIYYRDILNPYVFPTYHFICHSAWYVQISAEIVLCADCVISEHTFCVQSRQAAVWRWLHIIARTFHHTDLHCGRCYRLLLHTRRAIDCYDCRQTIIRMHGRTEQLEYRILCETGVPRGMI
jgi:hypothetical protein